MSIRSNNNRIIEQILAEQRALQPETLNLFPGGAANNAAVSPIDLSPEVGQEAVADTRTWNRDEPPLDEEAADEQNPDGVAFAGATFPSQRVHWDDTLKQLHIFTRLITIDSAGAIYDIAEEVETMIEGEQC